MLVCFLAIVFVCLFGGFYFALFVLFVWSVVLVCMIRYVVLCRAVLLCVMCMSVCLFGWLVAC